MKRVIHCGNCGMAGHYRAGCKNISETDTIIVIFTHFRKGVSLTKMGGGINIPILYYRIYQAICERRESGYVLMASFRSSSKTTRRIA